MTTDEPTTTTVQGLAAQGYRAFVTKVRDDGTVYTKTASTAPAWLTDLVYRAHAGMLPDDFKFELVRDALSWLGETDEYTDFDDLAHDFADPVDVYTSDLTAWLASHQQRTLYCDEYVSEMGAHPESIVDHISGGQYMERREVFGMVLDTLRDLAGEES